MAETDIIKQPGCYEIFGKSRKSCKKDLGIITENLSGFPQEPIGSGKRPADTAAEFLEAEYLCTEDTLFSEEPENRSGIRPENGKRKNTETQMSGKPQKEADRMSGVMAVPDFFIEKKQAGTKSGKKTALHIDSESAKEPNRKGLRIIPLGGLEQIGLNMTAIISGDDIIIIDCGNLFPDDDTSDIYVPGSAWVKANRDRIRAYFITHGHEDHIGGLPYVTRTAPAPIYGTAMTTELIRNKFESENYPQGADLLNIVEYGDTIRTGRFAVEYIVAGHSIPGSAMLAVTAPEGTVIHSGDFKMDLSPVRSEEYTDLKRIMNVCSDGVLALLCESTNAEQPGYTPSEKTVKKALEKTFTANRDKRIIITTFASNVDRIQQIADTAINHGRKIAFVGKSMTRVSDVAINLGILRMPPGSIVPAGKTESIPDNSIAIIVTGNQGEPAAVLSRLANGACQEFSLNDNDVVVFSSSVIPGNEKKINMLINSLLIKGVAVETGEEFHVSGHARQDEIKLLMKIVGAEYVIPIHGEFRHRIACRDLAEYLGYDRRSVPVIWSGDILEFSEKGLEIKGRVSAGKQRITAEKRMRIYASPGSKKNAYRGRQKIASN